MALTVLTLSHECGMYMLIYVFVVVISKPPGPGVFAMPSATAEFSSKETCMVAGKALPAVVNLQGVEAEPKEVNGWMVVEKNKGGGEYALVKWRCFPK